MRKWGIAVTLLYALILLGLIVPGTIFLVAKDFPEALAEAYRTAFFWMLAGAVLASQALLLFLSVDTSRKRLKPRTHVLVSCAVAGLLTALLTSAIVWSLGFAIRGDDFWDALFKGEGTILLFWAGLWALWGVVFYRYLRNSTAVVGRIVGWLLKGSVLDLLVAVPCHVLVRRRGDCSAPAVTGFGIATGIAIMLLAFGPSVLFLYKKRLDGYARRTTA
jgi:hypothetical protein